MLHSLHVCHVLSIVQLADLGRPIACKKKCEHSIQACGVLKGDGHKGCMFLLCRR